MEGSAEQIVIPKPIEHEMSASYIDYAMSVIVGRALPDVRDGLKPVHRRILYGMSELGLASNKATKKSARVVGEVLGKYHPHGDVAVYDALVRMAQDFSLRYPLVHGQGNFGSVDGDNAAAMRYTECRLTAVAEELLEDLEKDTVAFTDNFDATLKEPSVLPGKFPDLLCNGSSGIAVGMATNIPPHNLREVVDALVTLIERPGTTIQQLAEKLPGPDFPTGGIIQGRQGILEAYASGRGIIRVRAKTHDEELKGRIRIIVDELPYQVNKANLLKDVAELVKEKKIEDVSDLRDESDREGMRVVIELKKNASPEIVLNQLFAHTQLEASFGILNLALVDGAPQVLDIKGMLSQYLSHREVVVTRRTRFLLRKAQEREHVLEGLVVALTNLDPVIELIRASRDPEAAKAALIQRFQLSDVQAKAVLEMRLGKLTSLEVQGVRDELAQVKTDIARYTEILASREEVLKIIKTELLELREKYGDDRRTQIVDEGGEIFVEDLIPDETVVVTITNRGWIKRISLEEYRVQGRGGKGLIGMETKESDFVVDFFPATNHQYILFFSNKGKVYWLKTYKVPESSRYGQGKPVVNLLEGLEQGEEVQAAIPVREFSSERNVFFATRKGLVKKTALDEYANVRVTGIRAVNLEEGDELVGVSLSSGSDHVVLAKAGGKSIRFEEEEARAMGRTAYGVKGITVGEGDAVVSLAVLQGKGDLLTVKANGKGKRTPLEEYPIKHRGGLGQITIEVEEDGGSHPVVAMLQVEDGDEILATTHRGIVIRVPVTDIPLKGRYAQGNWIIRPEEGDRVVAVARIRKEAIQELTGADPRGASPPPSVPAEPGKKAVFPREPDPRENGPEAPDE